jgi:hypothetical protein
MCFTAAELKLSLAFPSKHVPMKSLEPAAPGFPEFHWVQASHGHQALDLHPAYHFDPHQPTQKATSEKQRP